MRRLLALLALFCLATVATAAAADWSHSVGRTADGAYQIGNPHAPVQLVEFLSLTCPHCALLSIESHEPLGAMIADGSVRVELRHAIRDPVDLAATLLARCAGAANLRETMHTLFALQPQWIDPGYDYVRTHPGAPLLQVADAAGLSQIARGFGLERPRVVACLTSKPDQLAVAHMAAAAWKLMGAHGTALRPAGTPSFIINGRFIDSTDWAGLEPQLKQAGAH